MHTQADRNRWIEQLYKRRELKKILYEDYIAFRCPDAERYPNCIEKVIPDGLHVIEATLSITRKNTEQCFNFCVTTMAGPDVPKLNSFADDFLALLSRLAPSINCDMPIGSKASGELVGDDYNRVAAVRGYIVPRLANNGDPPSARPHVTYRARLNRRRLSQAQCRSVFIRAIYGAHAAVKNDSKLAFD